MNAAAHIHDAAPELVALPVGTPARAEAYAHARTCVACDVALREAAELWTFLGTLPAEPPPAPAVLRAIRRPILAELAGSAVPVVFLSVVLLASWGALLLAARHRVDTRGAQFQSLALLVIAVVSIHLTRRGGGIAAVVVLGASLSSVALMAGDGPMGASVGGHCALTELAVAVLPAIVLARTFARRRSIESARPFAAVAAAAALAAQAALQRMCPFQSSGLHDLVFHFGGVASTALVAATVWSWRQRRAAPLTS